MKPTAIPVAIDEVNGIISMVKKAGTATSNRPQSIWPSDETIKIPTMIKAGAVTAFVTTTKSGRKNKDNKKHIPVTIDAKPDRAPAPTPADDST